MELNLPGIRDEIAEHLRAIAPMFKPDIKFTFLARHPTDPNAHVLVTNDEMEKVIQGIRELMRENRVV